MNQKNQKCAANKVKSVTAVFLLVFVNMIALLSVMPPVLGAGEKIYGCITVVGTSTPIPDAEVQVISPESGEFFIASTNVTGDYMVNLTMPGKYTVIIRKSGYSGDIQTLTITTGQTKLYNKSLQADTVAPTISDFSASATTGISPNHVSTMTMTIEEKWLEVVNVDFLMVMSIDGDVDEIVSVKRYTNMPFFNNPGNPMELLQLTETAPGTNMTSFTFDGTSTIAKFGDSVHTYMVPYGTSYLDNMGDFIILNGYYENSTIGTNTDAWFLDFNATTLQLQQIDQYISATGTFITDAVDLSDTTGKVQIMGEYGTFNTTSGQTDSQYVNSTQFVKINEIVPLVLTPTLPSGEYIVTQKVMDFGDNSTRDWTSITVDNTPPVAVAGANISIKQGEMAKFNGSASTDNMGPLNYTWTFSVGATDHTIYEWNGTSPVLNTIGVYPVTLNVSDEGGWFDTDVTYLNVTDGIAPVADAGLNITVEQDVLFELNGTATTDNVDTLAQLNFTWSFNNTVKNVTLYGAEPNYTLAKIASYKVELIVNDQNGNEAAPSYVWVNVTDGHAPVANAGFDFSVKQMALAHFNGSASTDNVDIVNYTWNFTDNSAPVKLYGWNATYTFDTIGVYNVTLTVKDLVGKTSTDLTVVTVLDGIAPVAHAGADQSDEIGINMTFNASSSSDNVGIVVYNWSFGDGTSSLGKVVTHAWTTVGVYTVTLTIKDAQNNSATDILNVTVIPKNHPPTISNIVPQTAYGGVQWALTTVFSDPDTTDILNFSLTNAPAGMVINAGTGRMTWTPATNQLWKSYSVTVTVTDSKATATKVFTIRAIAKNIILKVGPIKDKEGKVIKGAEVKVLFGTNSIANKTDNKGIAYITVPGEWANQTVDYTIKKAGYKDTKTHQGSIGTDGTFNPVNGYPRIESKQGTDYMFLIIVIVVLLVLALVLFSMKRPTDDDSVLDDDEKEPGEEALSEEE